MKRVLFGLASLASTFAVACTRQPESCQITCNASCPDGLRCSAGYCVTANFAGTCSGGGERDANFAGRRESALPPLDEAAPAPAESGEQVAGSPAALFAPESSARLEALAPCTSGGLTVQPCPLPAPCVGVDYDVQLSVLGSAGPHAWQGSTANGLVLSSTGRVSGRATGPGQLTVQLRSGGATAALSLPFAARDSCWFAYLPASSEAERVGLIDPVLAPAEVDPLYLPRTLPAGDMVRDFAFSPDGRLLVTRVVSATGSHRLELFQAPDWRERAPEPLPPGDASFYVWSPDSTVLAVVLRTAAGDVLSGLRVSPAAAGEAPAALEPVPSPVPLSAAPTWFGGDRLVYAAAGPEDAPDRVSLFDTRLTARGFVPIQAHPQLGYAQSTLRLRGAPEGFFALYQFAGLTPSVEFFHPVEAGLDFRTHAADVVLAPGSSHVARVAAPSSLEIIRAAELLARAEDPGALRPAAVASGCTTLLAWSPSSERVACLAGSEGGSIDVFGFDAQTSALTPPLAVEGDYLYDSELASFRRRVLSARGQHLAFSTGAILYLARLAGDRYLLEREPTFLGEQSVDAELSFSPDERSLLQHQGSGLWLHVLAAPEPAQRVAVGLPAAARCSETGSQEDWCGSAGRTAAIAWAADSSAAAFLTSDTGALQLSRPVASGPRLLACSSCRQFDFQGRGSDVRR